jgi:hypothetical protein
VPFGARGRRGGRPSWSQAGRARHRLGFRVGPEAFTWAVVAIDDEQLLALIRQVFDDSPFTGEGYRKVHARLRREHGVRVGRKRVRYEPRQEDARHHPPREILSGRGATPSSSRIRRRAAVSSACLALVVPGSRPRSMRS